MCVCKILDPGYMCIVSMSSRGSLRGGNAIDKRPLTSPNPLPPFTK